ncbi:hypothetical protein M5K25_023320 [Dendrobium thyrsiflorum]|uniref:Uncharacterized protein n=1 Tax=Dendrobium thyrsiflorum TaxID=117978 RepID=A0ABD0UEK7_DENTH
MNQTLVIYSNTSGIISTGCGPVVFPFSKIFHVKTGILSYSTCVLDIRTTLRRKILNRRVYSSPQQYVNEVELMTVCDCGIQVEHSQSLLMMSWNIYQDVIPVVDRSSRESIFKGQRELIDDPVYVLVGGPIVAERNVEERGVKDVDPSLLVVEESVVTRRISHAKPVVVMKEDEEEGRWLRQRGRRRRGRLGRSMNAKPQEGRDERGRGGSDGVAAGGKVPPPDWGWRWPAGVGWAAVLGLAVGSVSQRERREEGVGRPGRSSRESIFKGQRELIDDPVYVLVGGPIVAERNVEERGVKDVDPSLLVVEESVVTRRISHAKPVVVMKEDGEEGRWLRQRGRRRRGRLGRSMNAKPQEGRDERGRGGSDGVAAGGKVPPPDWGWRWPAGVGWAAVLGLAVGSVSQRERREEGVGRPGRSSRESIFKGQRELIDDPVYVLVGGPIVAERNVEERGVKDVDPSLLVVEESVVTRRISHAKPVVVMKEDGEEGRWLRQRGRRRRGRLGRSMNAKPQEGRDERGRGGSDGVAAGGKVPPPDWGWRWPAGVGWAAVLGLAVGSVSQRERREEGYYLLISIHPHIKANMVSSSLKRTSQSLLCLSIFLVLAFVGLFFLLFAVRLSPLLRRVGGVLDLRHLFRFSLRPPSSPGVGGLSCWVVAAHAEHWSVVPPSWQPQTRGFCAYTASNTVMVTIARTRITINPDPPITAIPNLPPICKHSDDQDAWQLYNSYEST